MNTNVGLTGLRSAIRGIFVAKGVEVHGDVPSRVAGQLTAFGCAGVLAFAPAAWALPITYNINLTPALNLTGTITTDGTTGVLAASNFVGFDLHINFPPSFDVAGTSASCDPAGCGITVTGSQLLFNGILDTGITFNGPSAILVLSQQDGGYNAAYYTSLQSFSTTVTTTLPIVLGTAAVPEPGTLALTALAFAGLAAARRRRQSQKPATAT